MVCPHANCVLERMKRIFTFAVLGALLASFLALNAFVNAAPPRQDPPPAAPRATRDPIQQATRRARRGVPPINVPPAASAPEPVLEGEDEESISAAEVNPRAPGPMSSQIVIFNPDTSGAATVRLDVYNAAGAVAYTTNLTVSPNGMKLVPLPGSLGANFQGGAEISSDKNVQALVVGANANNTARDSYEGAMSPAQDVTLPFVRHLAVNTQNTILAIQNTTANNAGITVRFYNPDGSVANTQNLNIVAHQSAYLNTNSIFLGNAFTGSVRVTSDQDVAVAAQTLYYQDTAALSGADASESDTVLLLNEAARKINGGGVPVNWSEIFVRNNGTNATNVTLDFYSLTGALVTSFPPNAVAPDGMAQFLLKDAAYDALGNNFTGWVKISSSGEPVSATSLQVLSKGKRMYSVNGLVEDGLGTRYVCGNTLRMTTQNSRLSILNTDAVKTAKAIVRLYNQDTGAKVVQTKVTVPPNSTITVLLSDSKFASAGTNYQGMALVQVNGASPAQVVVSASTPYGSKKLTGTTGYSCSPL